MAFENLTNKLRAAFKNLRGKGKLSEADVKEAMREVKLALLEADVNFKVVKSFVAAVTEKAVGGGALDGLNPAQQVIKIVRDQLVDMMGSEHSELTFASRSPTVYMLVGLQGSGKTTTCSKLAGHIKKQGKNPLLAACDVYRPAAVKQLEVMAKRFNVPVFKAEGDPVSIAEKSIEYAKDNGSDVVIIDTAGRLHVDERLMSELADMKKAVNPQEILLVVDAMTGQDAVNVAQSFNEQLGVDGLILTKLDGDARGGAALSARAVTGKPVKFIGTGEKPEDIEPFYPDRMTSRILGMGDVLSLIEKAQTAIDEKEAAELEKRLRENRFTLEDFLAQLKRIRKIGSVKNIIGLMPGLSQAMQGGGENEEKELSRIEALILSMTPKERENPDIINGSRKRRIAKGCGQTIQSLNRFLKQFDDIRKLMKRFSDGSHSKKGKLRFPFM
ncbi:MAG: signal recognition particle protein [Clostridiales bacterium]|jgi:signal recognition particle subunit SRP54|nr:signal recognition particle protein [Clostridiales bacterium]